MKSKLVPPAWDLDLPALDRMFVRYRAALCGSTLLMVGMSWPLWIDADNFPRVPFLASMPDSPSWVSWLVLLGMVTTLAMAALGRGGRGALRICLLLVTISIVGDQNRCQPWAYQFLVIGLAMAWMSKARALRMARWYVFGLYWYSSLSKLDASFCRELGPTFLSAALEPLGFEVASWPGSTRTLACLGMPAFEGAVGLLLVYKSTRRIGLVGAVAQHLSLIFILGPWNLGHSTIVLVWNAALIVEDILLFGRSTIPVDLEPLTRSARLTRGVFWLAMLFPGFERFGLCDAWPGHALYASHAERSDIYLHDDDLGRYPESIRRHLGPADLNSWRRLDLTGWSRAVRGTPIYPSGRVSNAVAEFVEAKYSGTQPVKLVQWGRARPWDVARERDESLGIKAIRRRADQFLLNAHPAG